MKALLLIFLAGVATADLKPIMAVPDKEVMSQDFAKPLVLDKETWLQRQGTRWVVTDGVLRGQASSAEFQAKRSHHRGLEPRLSIPKTPAEFVASFSLRFLDGAETKIAPFVEFGHHVCRIRFSESGLSVLVDGESLQVAASQSFVYEPGKWYHLLVELKGADCVMQFADGPTFYATHESFAKPVKSGGNGIGVAGPRGGTVELDNLRMWTVKDALQPNWSVTRASLAKSKPIAIEKPKKKAKK